MEVSSGGGGATVADRERAARRRRLDAVAAEAEVARILDGFPGAEIVAVGDAGGGSPEGAPGEGRRR